MANGFDNGFDDRLLPGGEDDEYAEPVGAAEKEDDSEEYYELPLAIKSRTLIWAVVSFAMGILSLALCIFPYVGIVFSALALGASLVSRKNLGFFEKYSIMGLVLGIMGFVCNVFSIIASAIGLFS